MNDYIDSQKSPTICPAWLLILNLISVQINSSQNWSHKYDEKEVDRIVFREPKGITEDRVEELFVDSHSRLDDCSACYEKYDYLLEKINVKD